MPPIIMQVMPPHKDVLRNRLDRLSRAIRILDTALEVHISTMGKLPDDQPVVQPPDNRPRGLITRQSTRKLLMSTGSQKNCRRSVKLKKDDSMEEMAVELKDLDEGEIEKV